MTIIESLSVSLFCISLVFFVLSCVFLLIKMLSKVLSRIGPKRAGISIATKDEAGIAAAREVDGTDESGISTGELKLIDVDEKTAAMIMAIVSHEFGLPLSELSFKSIKAMGEA